MTKNKPIRVPEALWAQYEVVVAAEGTNRSADVRAHMERRVEAYRQAHPGVVLPGDEAWADEG